MQNISSKIVWTVEAQEGFYEYSIMPIAQFHLIDMVYAKLPER